MNPAMNPARSALTQGDRACVRAQGAAYDYARHVWFVHTLLTGPTGKILTWEIVAPAELRAR